jgi:hypothetical protein
MQTQTLFFIILSGIIALVLALFQYRTKAKSMSRKNMLFAFLRFITILSVLLLLINPKFEQHQFYTEKPNLVIAIDNSSSIKHLQQSDNTLRIVNKLKEDEQLKSKFNLDFYTFTDELKTTDSISFKGAQTNLDQAFSQLGQIYKNTISPTILITDGNQTYGNDYQFSNRSYKQPVYPIILGDTITYTDLKVQHLNVNKYAYLKNKFPVEVILVYEGKSSISTSFEVYEGFNKVYSKPLSFTKQNNSKVLNFILPANQVGVSSYKASIIPLANEKNTVNNVKNFAVEVIDQKTNIAIVSDISHPDLGALKKSIESNEQRSVSFIKPKDVIDKINDFQLIILHHPNNKFKESYSLLNKQNKNRFVIAGTKTDLSFLNSVSEHYTYQITNQEEDVQASVNLNYPPFIINGLNFESLPPLKSYYGDITFSIPYEPLFNKKTGRVTTENPLLATFETTGRREAVLFGENIWQWRSQSFLNSKSFNAFDDFIGKLMQYLASNKKRSRLNVDYESFYNGNNGVVVNAQVFDKNYVFDPRETLTIKVMELISKEEKSFPFVRKNNHFQVDLGSLKASQYSFKVSATNQNISKTGNFEILEYHVEQQFLNANVTKLQQLATNSGGASYFIVNTDGLIADLLSDNRYVAIQKSNKNTVPLIDWKYLLFLIAFSLTIEWVLRKYNGLI